MEFRQSGGQGMLEEMTGLPINMRRVHCRYGQPSGSMAMNLEAIAVEFYEANCAACEYRRPNGLVPTLASLVGERARAAEARRKEAGHELSRRRLAWEDRADARRVLAAGAPPPMSKALADVGLVDPNPSASRDRDSVAAAIGRLEAVSDRAPELFARDVVQHISGLVCELGLAELLGPLRRLARSLPEHARSVLELALGVLTKRPDVEAGRCLVDLAAVLTSADLTTEVVRSLALLAGQPERDHLGHPRLIRARNDPAGLRLAVGMIPQTVRSVLQGLLRVAVAERPALVLPVGVPYPGDGRAASDFERCAAAGAIRALASTHRQFAVSLTQALAQSLRAGDSDRHDLRPTSDAQATLAILFIADAASVLAELEQAAVHAGAEHRERLFGVMGRARNLLDEDRRWREPGDPDVPASLREQRFRELVQASFARLGGDWGETAICDAAAELDELAKDAPGFMAGDVQALVGAFLAIVGRLESGTTRSVLATTNDATSRAIAALEAQSLRYRMSAAAQRLLDAVGRVAVTGPRAVLAVLIDVLRDERDNGRELPVAWWLVPVLGKLGREHGSEPAPAAARLDHSPKHCGTFRDVPVHRPGAERDLRACCPPNQARRESHQVLRPQRSGGGGGCGMGDGRCLARRGASPV
jgi:hypothetical protein